MNRAMELVKSTEQIPTNHFSSHYSRYLVCNNIESIIMSKNMNTTKAKQIIIIVHIWILESCFTLKKKRLLTLSNSRPSVSELKFHDKNQGYQTTT